MVFDSFFRLSHFGVDGAEEFERLRFLGAIADLLLQLETAS